MLHVIRSVCIWSPAVTAVNYASSLVLFCNLKKKYVKIDIIASLIRVTE